MANFYTKIASQFQLYNFPGDVSPETNIGHFAMKGGPSLLTSHYGFLNHYISEAQLVKPDTNVI